jgi:SAM-dependent methyltransferase
MDASSFRDYAGEVDTWHKRGRSLLIRSVLRRHLPRHNQHLILEVGAGVGQNVGGLREFGSVDAVEPNPHGAEALRQRAEVQEVFNEAVPFPLNRKYDVVCAFDVIEHIKDDQGVINWCHDLLSPGGILFVMVPAYSWMFSLHDVALDHQRRYSRGSLVNLFQQNWNVLHSNYFVSSLFPLAALSRVNSILAYRMSRWRDTGRPPQLAKQAATMKPVVDRAFLSILGLEARLIEAGARLPIGLSTFVVASPKP